jgi:betaine-homocysteine S-methyltransferase
VDFIIGETFIHCEEALLALEAITDSGLPAMITMNIGPSGSREGVLPEECARRLVGQGADIVGVNCSFDPETSLITAGRMREATDAYVACEPIGYRTPDASIPFTLHPEFPLALEGSQLTRFALADFARRAKATGVNFIGGCCGVAPYHIRAMAEALGRRPPASEKSPDLARHAIPHVREKSDPEFWQRSGAPRGRA